MDLKRWLRPELLLGLGILLALYYAGLGSVPYFQPDEGRYTEIPREMLATGDFVLPHLNGVLYFEKPPLYYWLNLLSISIFGVNEFASRFWSATLGLLGLLPVYHLARSAATKRAGVFAVAILGTSPLYLSLSHLTIIDMTLNFFFTLTLALFYLGSVEQSRPRQLALFYGMFAAAALAVLTKGLLGIVLPGGIVFMYLLLGGGWALLKRVPWVTGIALFLLIAVPWHLLAAARNGDFLWFYFVREHFLRYLTTVHDRIEPWWFFLPVVAWALLPWTALLPGSFWRQFHPSGLRSRLFREAGPALFCWLWAGVTILFFSLSNSKLIPYILPALPPLAVLAAIRVEAILGTKSPPSQGTRILLVIACAFCAVFGAAFVWGGMGRIEVMGAPESLSMPFILAGAGCVVVSVLSGAFVLANRYGKAFPAMVLCAGASFACIWIAGPSITSSRRVDGFAAFIQQHRQPTDLVFSYRYYPQALPVYLGETIGVAAFEGELAFGVSKLPEEERRRRFPDAEGFAALWDSPTRVWCVTTEAGLQSLKKVALAEPVVLLRQRHVRLITNRPLPGPVP